MSLKRNEWDWAVPVDMDGNEIFTLLTPPGTGVPAELGRDLTGKSVHNESGDSAGRMPVFVGRAGEGGLKEGGGPTLRRPLRNT